MQCRLTDERERERAEGAEVERPMIVCAAERDGPRGGHKAKCQERMAEMLERTRERDPR